MKTVASRPPDPASYPKDGTFGELLAWHLETWGTRPGCSTEEKGVPWSPKDIALRVHYPDSVPDDDAARGAKKNIANWKVPGNFPHAKFPDRVERLFAELFGGEESLRFWKEDLENALKRDRLAKTEEAQARQKRRKVDAEPAPIEARAVPLPTAHLVGRNEEVEALSDMLVSGASRAILLQGGPGIGKTELTKAIAHHEPVAAQFGERRWFVPLEAATSADAMSDAIVRALGFDPAGGLQAALGGLGPGPSLLVLDNLETPWEPVEARPGTEQLLASLARQPGLFLLASFRGMEWVSEPDWTCRVVEPLANDACLHLFSEIAGSWVVGDVHLPLFLDALGGIPLAIQLVARRAHGRKSLDPLWREWNRIGIDLAAKPGFDAGRQTSLARSIQLSLQSERINADAKRLFSLLGFLPQGISRGTLQNLMGDSSFVAEERLLSVGLAIERDQRLDVLPPLRDFAQRHQPPVEVDVLDACEHFIALTKELGTRIIQDGDGPATLLLQQELRNIESVIRAELASKRSGSFLEVADIIYQVALLRGVSTYLFKEVAESSEADAEILAKCLYLHAQLAFYRDDADTAAPAYEKALRLYRDRADIKGQGVCFHGLGNVALMRAQFDAARSAYLESLEFCRAAGFAMGVSTCVGRLGEVALERGEPDEAYDYFQEALVLNRQSGAFLAEGSCLCSLGQIELARANEATAEASFEEALKIFRRVGSAVGEAFAIKGIGDVACARAQYDRAKSNYEVALAICRSTHSVSGEGNCIEGLGNVSLAVSGEATALEFYEAALITYRRAKDVKGERRCLVRIESLQAMAE